MVEYRRCVRCLMDTTDPQIVFSPDGTCNHCSEFLKQRDRLISQQDRKARLDQLVRDIQEAGRGKPYDCVVGVSGGVDSTYVAYLAKQLGLRPLAVHLDNGWNSELAVKNIENTLSKLEIDLHTHVLDWDSFRELQASFLRASVPDAEIPTDHAIRAALWQAADKYGIKYLLNGRNHTTEGILPWSWTYSALDWRYINGVHRTFSRKSLRKYPHTSLPTILYRAMVTRFKNISILDYVGFDKASVMDILTNTLGWRDYGGKHYESIYTRFFQSYILPTKFGIDKRKAHLSVLVLTGQMTREAALGVLEQPTAPAEIIKDDREFVVQKLGMTEEEFGRIMQAPIKSYRDYPNNSWVFLMHDNKWMMRLARILRRIGVLPRGFGDNVLAEDKPAGGAKVASTTSHR